MHPTRERILQELVKERLYPLSVRQLAGELQLPHSTLTHHLGMLRWAGLVDWEPRMARTLVITEAGREALENGVEDHE